MKSLVLAQQSSLTFDQFKWVWVAAFSVFGLLLIIGGLVVSRRTRVGRMEARQKLMGFIRSGVLWEEDITQALNAPHLSPAPPDLTPQMWLDRILDGSPLIEQLLLNWQRPWGAEACLFAGIGLLLACGLCALLFLIFPGTNSAVPQGAAPDGVMLASMFALPLLGMFFGLGQGAYIGVFKMAAPAGQDALVLERPARPMEQYRPAWIRRVGIFLFLLPLSLTASALFFAPAHRLELVIEGLGILPALTLGAVLLHEHFLCRLAFLPPLQLSENPTLAGRADAAFFPRLITGISLLEYGLLVAMAIGHIMLILPSLPPEEDAVVYGKIALGLLAFYLILPFFIGLVERWLGRRHAPEQTNSDADAPSEDSTETHSPA